MKRRDFFKVISGFVAGIFATSAIAKEKPKLTVAMLQKAKKELGAKNNQCEWNGRLKCGGQNGTLCSRCKYNRKEPVETWSASGKTYYVDEVNGDDKNDGLTWGAAKKNWLKILEV